jgi:hypothetical protein
MHLLARSIGPLAAALAAALGLACGSGASGDDAPFVDARPDGPIRFSAGAFFEDSLPHDDLTLRVAGEVIPWSSRYETVFPDLLDPLAYTHCSPDPAPLTSVRIGHCAYGHGELRHSGATVDQGSWGCIYDGFCETCLSVICRPGSRCSSSFADEALTYSRLECLPHGLRAPGEPCSWTRNADARWIDDCDAGAVCLDGTCRERCFAPGDCSGTCVTPPRHPPELKVCL